MVHSPIAIKIADCGTALLPVNGNARFLTRNRGKSSGSVAAKQKSASCVQAVVLSTHGKKVLAQKNVFVTIAIEIGDGEGEGRRPLRLWGQRQSFEMIATIEKQHGGEAGHLEAVSFREIISKDLLDAGAYGEV